MPKRSFQTCLMLQNGRRTLNIPRTSEKVSFKKLKLQNKKRIKMEKYEAPVTAAFFEYSITLCTFLHTSMHTQLLLLLLASLSQRR